jgi:hypothetical protein
MSVANLHLEGFSESMKYELEGFGIKVILVGFEVLILSISPGFMLVDSVSLIEAFTRPDMYKKSLMGSGSLLFLLFKLRVGPTGTKKGKNNLSRGLYELAEMITILCNLFIPSFFCISVDFDSMLLCVL